MSERVLGIARMSPTRWSSVMMTTTLGRVIVCAESIFGAAKIMPQTKTALRKDARAARVSLTHMQLRNDLSNVLRAHQTDKLNLLIVISLSPL
jgi:hypothetical protein